MTKNEIGGLFLVEDIFLGFLGSSSFLDLGFSFCLLTVLCSYQFNPFKKVDNWNVIWWDDYIFQPEQPLQPQCTHSTIFPSSNLVFGTRQMQLVEKLVSLVWIQRRQQRFSYPCFFHLAMRFWSAIFSFKQKSYNSVRKLSL